MSKAKKLLELIEGLSESEKVELTFWRLLEVTTPDGVQVVLAVYRDKQGNKYLSCCGWGTDEGYKLRNDYPEVEVVYDGKDADGDDLYKGEKGIYFSKVKDPRKAAKEAFGGKAKYL